MLNERKNITVTPIKLPTLVHSWKLFSLNFSINNYRRKKIIIMFHFYKTKNLAFLKLQAWFSLLYRSRNRSNVKATTLRVSLTHNNLKLSLHE